MRLPSAQFLEAESPQQLVHSPLHLRRRPSEVLESECHVVLDALRDELVLRVLEEDAHVAASCHTAILHQQVVAAHDGDAGGGRLVQPAQQPGERGLSRPVRADDGDELTGGHHEVQSGKRLAGGAGVAIVEVAHLDDGRLGAGWSTC